MAIFENYKEAVDQKRKQRDWIKEEEKRIEEKMKLYRQSREMQSMGQHSIKVDLEQRKKEELENRIKNLEAKEALALERLKRTEAMTQKEAEKLI